MVAPHDLYSSSRIVALKEILGTLGPSLKASLTAAAELRAPRMGETTVSYSFHFRHQGHSKIHRPQSLPATSGDRAILSKPLITM